MKIESQSTIWITLTEAEIVQLLKGYKGSYWDGLSVRKNLDATTVICITGGSNE